MIKFFVILLLSGCVTLPRQIDSGMIGTAKRICKDKIDYLLTEPKMVGIKCKGQSTVQSYIKY